MASTRVAMASSLVAMSYSSLKSFGDVSRQCELHFGRTSRAVRDHLAGPPFLLVPQPHRAYGHCGGVLCPSIGGHLGRPRGFPRNRPTPPVQTGRWKHRQSRALEVSMWLGKVNPFSFISELFIVGLYRRKPAKSPNHPTSSTRRFRTCITEFHQRGLEACGSMRQRSTVSLSRFKRYPGTSTFAEGVSSECHGGAMKEEHSKRCPGRPGAPFLAFSWYNLWFQRPGKSWFLI